MSNNIKSLAIIAGAGNLPEILAYACEEKGIEPFIVFIEGYSNPDICEGREFVKLRLGQIARMIPVLKSHKINDLCLIGSISRPSISDMKPDLKTMALLARIGLDGALGDDGLLKAIKRELTHEGFTVHGAHEFIDDILTKQGVYGSIKPCNDDWIDINRGVEILNVTGCLDIGQSVIVQEGIVLGIEAIEGTDKLIERCKYLKRSGRGGVLVKMSKQGQEEKLDMPVIGTETIENCINAGLSGIALQSQKTMIVDRDEVTKLADSHKLFVIGV